MPKSTYYVQECPTCGRNLQIRIEYLGKQVVCQHCGACFEACEPGSAAYPPSASSLSLLQRAEELLESSSTITSVVGQTVSPNASAVPPSPATGKSAPVRPK
jgi:ferredoxin